MTFQAKVLNVGGDSIGIIIPQQVALGMRIEKGDSIIIEIKKVKK